MNFKETNERLGAAMRAQAAATDACARTWRIADTLHVEIRPTSYGHDGIHVMGFWMRRGDTYRDANRVDDLTARELRQMAAVRDLVEQWMAGTIDDLPTECPLEIVRLA